MIIPCIDLMGGRVVQLVQGKEKALELPDPIAVLGKFSTFSEIQVIDLDAAMGREPQVECVRELCRRKACRVGGGIRSLERALEALSEGAHKVIVGSAAFTPRGIDHNFLQSLTKIIPRQRLVIAVDCLNDQVAIQGWSEVLSLNSGQALPQLESYCSEFLCTCIEVEGRLQGTNLAWFQRLRQHTQLPITAAGGITTDQEVRALEQLGMNAALGMSIYRQFFPELFGSGEKDKWRKG
jgi:phosphoribosylformimino-5-aminoimidazole carboxamide ribonucleotide (ProFAR) isomerase